MKKFNTIVAALLVVVGSVTMSCSKQSEDFLTKEKSGEPNRDADGDGLVDNTLISFVNLVEGGDLVNYDVTIDGVEYDLNLEEGESSFFIAVPDEDGTQTIEFTDEFGNVVSSYEYDFAEGEYYQVVMSSDQNGENFQVDGYEMDYTSKNALNQEGCDYAAVNAANYNTSYENVTIQNSVDQDSYSTSIPGFANLGYDAGELSETSIVSEPIGSSTRLINTGSELTETYVNGVAVAAGSDEIFDENTGIMEIECSDVMTYYVTGDDSQTNIVVNDLQEAYENIDFSAIDDATDTGEPASVNVR